MSKARMAVDNSLDYPEIRKPIIQWGFSRDSILEGRTLYQAAESLLNEKDRRYAELEGITGELEDKRKTGRKIYIDHLRLARIIIPASNKEYRVSLALSGSRPMRGGGWLDKARLFYQTALESPEILKILKAVGLTKRKLKAGAKAIREIELSDNKQEIMKGIAQEATHQRNEAFEALASWLSGFYRVCDLVFPSGPERQRLERLGIPAITSPNRKKKN